MSLSFDFLVNSVLRAKEVAMQFPVIQETSDRSFYTTHILFNIDTARYDFRLRDVAHSGKIDVVPEITQIENGVLDDSHPKLELYLGELEYIEHSNRISIDRNEITIGEQYSSVTFYGINLEVGIYASDNFVEMIRVDVGPRDGAVR